eukprot:6848083-Ditylum_brightwellii.AAC.1
MYNNSDSNGSHGDRDRWNIHDGGGNTHGGVGKICSGGGNGCHKRSGEIGKKDKSINSGMKCSGSGRKGDREKKKQSAGGNRLNGSDSNDLDSKEGGGNVEEDVLIVNVAE